MTNGTSTHPGTKTFAKLGLALLFLVPIIAFLSLALEIQEPGPLASTSDVRILNFIHSHANHTLDFIALHGTNLGGPAAIILFTAVVSVLLYVLHKRRAMTILIIGVGGAAVINTLLKLIFHRVRPSLWTSLISEKSFSFPSGHAMASSALVFSIIFIAWKTKWHWYALVLGLLYMVFIGFTRLYLGVHYPSDILAGWCVSLVWILTVRAILTRRQKRAAAKEIEG